MAARATEVAAQRAADLTDSPIADSAGRARVAGDGATVAADVSIADVLRLQRSVGNRAVSKLLQRDGPAPPPPPDQLTSPRFMGPGGAPDPTLEACFEDRARLTVGAEGGPVKMVQQALADLGYDLGPTGVDGIYGSHTARAVRSFKADQKLGFEQFGDVGPGTMHRLDQLFPATGQSGPSERDLFDVATFGSYQAFYDAALQGTASKTSLSVAERTALADRIARRVMDLIFTTGFGHDPDSLTGSNSAAKDWRAHFTSALQVTTAGDYKSVDEPIRQAAAMADQASQATRKRGRDVNAKAGAPGASEQDLFNQATFGEYQELYDVALQGTASKAGLTVAEQVSLADRIARRVMDLVFTTGGFGPDPDFAPTSKFASHDWRGHFQSALQVTAGGSYTSVDVPIRQAAAIADQASQATRKRGRDVNAKAGAPGASEQDLFNQATFGEYQELYDVALQGTASKAGLTVAEQVSLADRIARRVMDLVFTTGGFGPDPDFAPTSKFASHDWRGHFQSALQVTAGGSYTSVDVPIKQAAAIADQAAARTRKKGRDDAAKVKGTFP